MATKHQQHIFMPNEIFDNLKRNVEKEHHISFLYSYYYFICHLYRYCEYEGATQAIIKQRLGYNPKEKRLDYLIKKDGVLDRMGYTQTTTNYPLSWNMDEDGFIDFTTIDDYRNEFGTTSIISDRNFKVKYPVKLFHRTEESFTDRVLDGTLYDVSNTHNISFKQFDKCMKNGLLGVQAFYIYGYLCWKNDMYGDYRVSSRTLAEELGFSKTTLFKYLGEMELAKLLKITHKKFIGIEGEANLYRTLT